MASRPKVVAFDARDAFVAMPHGSGIYVRRLLGALQAQPPADLELWPVRHGGRGPELLFEQLTLPRLLRRREAALVHGPDSFLPLRRRCPGVVTIHDLGFEAIPGDMPRRTELKYRALVRAAARSAQRIICPSEFTAADVARRYRIPRERIRVIAEAPALAPGTGTPPAGPYLLAAGDLRPRKNLAVLVEAFKRLHDAGLPHRLILAGADLGQAARLRALARPAPVELPGFVDDDRLDALIRGADALVVPGVYEGFGLIALEAMARGCPVVLARAGALPETGGEAARYFEPSEVSDLAEVVSRLVGDRVQRAQLADAGRVRANGFTWEATGEATLAVYRELL